MSKFKCQKCDRVFQSQCALNGHQNAHKTGPRYSVDRKSINSPARKKYICQQCNNEFPYLQSSMNKFCSSQCYADYRWENIEIPKILSGKGGNGVKRYLRESRGDKCEECGLGNEWNGKPLTLQLDHIDGDSDNDDIENLRLLCPNCHTQTPTFGNAGKGSRYKKNTKRNRYLQEYKKKSG